MAEINLILWKSQPNKDGTVPVRLKIAKFRKTSYYTVTSVKPEHWNGSEVTGGEDKNKKNVKIRSLRSELEGLTADLERKNKNITAAEILKAFKGDRSGSFFAFAFDFIERYNNENQQYTYSKFKMILNDFKEFSGEIAFDELTYELLSRYRIKLKNHGSNKKRKPNKDSAIESKFTKLATIFNEAARCGKADRNKYPFDKFQFDKSKTRKEKLSKEELALFRSVKLKRTNQILSRDIFLFCFNCMGMRVGDAILMKVSNRRGNELIYFSSKSADPFTIALTDEARKIWDKYAAGKQPGDYVFPCMEKYKKKDKPLHKSIDSSTALINNNLKIIAKLAGISKHITTHVNRHTWNKLAMDAGISVTIRQRALGHEKEETTRNYDASLDDSVINEANRIVTNL